MSWVPPNLASLCTSNSTLSACQPSTLMFLTLVTNLFSHSEDSYPNKNIEKEYDFIIVGAGSAGCVVANRLSGVKHWKISLLKPGIKEPEVADIPAFATTLLDSNIDWMYRMQSEQHSCRSRKDRGCAMPRGKVMGGSSTTNFMIYARGNRKDYDEWADAGNRGWSYEEVLPYFLKSENNGDPHWKTIYSSSSQSVQRLSY